MAAKNDSKCWFEQRTGVTLTVMGEIGSRWKSVTDKYQEEKTIPQDNTFAKTEANIPGLIGIRLLDYQRSTVNTAIQLENRRTINVKVGDDDVIIYTSCGRIQESVGAGKTIESCAIPLKQRHPKMMPDVMAYDITKRPEGYKGRSGCIKVMYDADRILKPTVVFAGPSVVEQWADFIATNTELRCQVVRDKEDFQKTIDMISSKKINKYDIMVVKNDRLHGSIKWPAGITVMKKNMIGSPHMFNLMANLGYCWSRVIMDDLDIIGLPYNATLVPAIFRWFVSSTNAVASAVTRNSPQFWDVKDLLVSDTYGYFRILRNMTLNAILNITSSEKYIKEHNGLCTPTYKIFIFANSNDEIIGIIGSIDDASAKKIQEMINNDAFEDAAKAVGSKVSSVAEICQRLLGSKFVAYRKAERVLAFIESIPEDPKQRIPMSKNKNKLDKLYSKERLLKEDYPEYNYPNLKSILNEAKEEYTKIYNECGKTMESVKSHFQYKECPICTNTISEAYILTCCTAVYCADCTCRIMGFKKGGASNYKYGSAKKALDADCTRCGRIINFKNLIYVGTDVSKDTISDKYALTIEEMEAEEKKEAQEAAAAAVSDDSDSDSNSDSDSDSESADDPNGNGEVSKLDGLLKYCQGKKVGVKEETVTCEIPKIMTGKSSIQEKPKWRKVLVFVYFASAAKEIIAALKKKKITHWLLNGSPKKLSATAKEYNKYEGDCVLVISSQEYAAGLNLQPTTNVAVYAHVQNADVLSQAIGRAQRIGRTSRLEVAFFLYENEKQTMMRHLGLKTI